MEKIEAIKRISAILERDLKVTDDLDEIGKNIYDDLQQNNVIGSGFVKRFNLDTNSDDAGAELPGAIYVTTPMYQGQVYLKSSGNKYWYENSEGGTVLAIASKKIMLTKIQKYTK